MNTTSDPVAQPGLDPTGPCILAIEDNDDMREFLQRILERRGFRFLGASDGVDGMELAMQHRPDLILMDLALPTLDGYEATRLLKSMPDYAGIPIVAVTAHARAVDQEQALAAGCDAYISKPYSIHELYTLIDRFLPAAS
jgi:two-component system cell cycle response regulator DivK